MNAYGTEIKTLERQIKMYETETQLLLAQVQQLTKSLQAKLEESGLDEQIGFQFTGEILRNHLELLKVQMESASEATINLCNLNKHYDEIIDDAIMRDLDKEEGFQTH